MLLKRRSGVEEVGRIGGRGSEVRGAVCMIYLRFQTVDDIAAGEQTHAAMLIEGYSSSHLGKIGVSYHQCAHAMSRFKDIFARPSANKTLS